MFIDYNIENWVLILETGELGVFGLPMNGLGVIIGSMSTYYCATLEKLFILNPSWGLRTAWSVIEGFMDPETAAKIQLVKKSELNKLKE